ncbi:GNAT family N-acetyltransferase [Thiospirochaeta perfilievii]|uniref:GNAT family N-acetyltransferase n=1 Tax=Thiospirochaeta perfilievii TaxID=252967 RepID=A0A5C1QDM4_9SPIO|nr:GNAT family N-acetyltransferase [Thiospirochaeta perfilievii]QEN05681.1 GNAT family N-acetyltransferase [Thiospirochaeta perfilievii]
MLDPNLPIFLQDWYLEAVCGQGNYKKLEIKKNNSVIAWMPIFFKKRGPFRYITQPNFSQFHGPTLYFPKDQKVVKKNSFIDKNQDLILDLLEKEKFHSYNQNWNPDVSSWYSFYKRGYNMLVRYTYILRDLSNLDAVWAGFDNRLRTDIRKSEKNFTYEVSDSVDNLYSIEEKTFKRQNLSVPFSKSDVKTLFNAVKENNSGELLIAKSETGVISACVYLVWDKKTCYYILGGADPENRVGSPQAFLLWEAIKRTADRGLEFDFEGSMVPGIEKFFRSFGGERVPYYQVWKHRSKIFGLLKG